MFHWQRPAHQRLRRWLSLEHDFANSIFNAVLPQISLKSPNGLYNKVKVQYEVPHTAVNQILTIEYIISEAPQPR